jgi:hypothetical protein
MADYETIIIGGGRAGIALAMALIAAGRDDLCILERGAIPADVEAEVAAHDLRSFIRVGATAAIATWDAKRLHWEIAIQDAQRLTARCLVAAWGRPAALPAIAGSSGAPFAPGEALALPGFPSLLLLSGPDRAARQNFVLAATALLDMPGAIEAPAAAPFPPEAFLRIPVPEIVSIYC